MEVEANRRQNLYKVLVMINTYTGVKPAGVIHTYTGVLSW